MRGWASIISAKYCKGVQHNYRLAKNTKKKELGTAHHDASDAEHGRGSRRHAKKKK